MGWVFRSRRKDGTYAFGVADILVCEKCGSDAFISRRTPHPDRIPGLEVQTFSCPMCGQEQTRIADEGGDVSRAR
jgi:hypothetical protein